MSRQRLFLAAGAALILTTTACREDGLETYRVDKEPSRSSAAAPMMSPDAAPSGMGGMDFAPAVAPDAPREVTWTLPGGWTERPGSSMRYATLIIPGEGGREAELSVIALGPESGDVLPNVNRWREQLGLAPVPSANAAAGVQNIAPAGRKMTYVNIVSDDPLVDGKWKKRMLAALCARGERVWFFKMTGDDATVARAEPAFRKFLESLRGL